MKFDDFGSEKKYVTYIKKKKILLVSHKHRNKLIIRKKNVT